MIHDFFLRALIWSRPSYTSWATAWACPTLTRGRLWWRHSTGAGTPISSSAEMTKMQCRLCMGLKDQSQVSQSQFQWSQGKNCNLNNINSFLACPRLDPNFNNDNICANPKVDAIFLTADRSTYVFQGDNYWKLTKDSVAPGFPRKIYQDWRGLPSNIDAAFTWESTR